MKPSCLRDANVPHALYRYQHQRLKPLEIWHGLDQGRTLFELRKDESFFSSVFNFLHSVQSGSAETSDPCDTEDLIHAKDFKKIIFCGGGTLRDDFLYFLKQNEKSFHFRIFIDRHGPFAQFEGAKRIFKEMGWKAGLALDLGQSHLKLMAEGLNIATPRDEILLPIGRNSLDCSLGRNRILDFLKSGIQEMQIRLGARPDGLVLALPLKIDADGCADTCSYPGLSGDLSVLFSNQFEMPVVLINDAELAALSFLKDESSKSLVVTLGFAVGAALCNP